MLKENNFSIKGTVEFIHNNKEDISNEDKKEGEQNESKRTNTCGLNEDKIADAIFKKKSELENDTLKKNRIKSLFLNKKDLKYHEKVKDIEEHIAKADKTLISSGRIERKDVMFFSEDKHYVAEIKKSVFFIEDIKFINYLFIRAVATDFLFINIDFSKTIFDSCYLKDCRFINCKFEGAKFINCNLQGSYYQDCNFNYVTFEKTFVDFEIFECAPKWDNLRFRFARSLKLNYASIGDYIKASKAVTIELRATKKHLKDSWLLPDEWYKNKYGSLGRKTDQFFKWLLVSFLDFIWGNGERLRRLIRFNVLVFFVLTIYHYIKFPMTSIFCFLPILFVKVPANYLGIVIETTSGVNMFDYYSDGLNLILRATRLVCFGLLMSIIIKKYNRR